MVNKDFQNTTDTICNAVIRFSLRPRYIIGFLDCFLLTRYGAANIVNHIYIYKSLVRFSVCLSVCTYDVLANSQNVTYYHSPGDHEN